MGAELTVALYFGTLLHSSGAAGALLRRFPQSHGALLASFRLVRL
jgi:hypothetical protein